jgi:hypothetical protein
VGDVVQQHINLFDCDLPLACEQMLCRSDDVRYRNSRTPGRERHLESLASWRFISRSINAIGASGTPLPPREERERQERERRPVGGRCGRRRAAPASAAVAVVRVTCPRRIAA